jgi:preprotein translocase subunit SecF
MRWFETPNYPFVATRKIGYYVSGAMLIIAIAALLFKGLNYGIDFKGGKELVVEFDTAVSVTEVRDLLTNALGSQPEVKQFGLSRDLLVRTDSELEATELQNTIISTLTAAFPGNNVVIIKTDDISPRFADDLKWGALNAILFSMVVIFLYILVRFKNWTYSVGTIAAIAHDVIIILGVFVIFNDILPFSLDIDQNIIAAFLTIVGYSLNDTVVVFDRVREDSLVHKNDHVEVMVNRAMNATLSRTVVTSLTTLFVVIVLFIFGGEVLKGLAFALIVGIVLGTYSTLYVACPLVVDLKKTKAS